MAFGMNGNDIMVGGEAGKEAVLPLNKETLGGIGAGISATMDTEGKKENNIYITNHNHSPEPLSEREIARQTKLSAQRIVYDLF